MEFRQSRIGDIDQIVRIAEDAKAFLRSCGVGSVRVDTHPDNRAMRAALEKAGFAACGELLLDRCGEAGDPRVGYERILR